MARRRNNQRPHLRLVDFSDRELLALLADLEGAEGWVEAETVAREIWPQRTADADTLFHAKMSVTQRFVWLKRWGAVERSVENRAWRLTETGRTLVNGKLSARQQATLHNLGDDRMLHLGYAVAERYIAADGVSAVFLRRAMQFAHERRRGL